MKALNKFIKRSLSTRRKSNSKDTKADKIPTSPTSSTESYFLNNNSGSSENSSVENLYNTDTLLDSESIKKNEVLPIGWELRYDTILCQYYYVNLSENLVQFDSPLEVLKHSN